MKLGPAFQYFKTETTLHAMPRDLPVQLCHVSKLISDSDTVKLPRWCIQRLGIREGDPIVVQLQPDT